MCSISCPHGILYYLDLICAFLCLDGVGYIASPLHTYISLPIDPLGSIRAGKSGRVTSESQSAMPLFAVSPHTRELTSSASISASGRPVPLARPTSSSVVCRTFHHSPDGSFCSSSCSSKMADSSAMMEQIGHTQLCCIPREQAVNPMHRVSNLAVIGRC